MFNLEGFASFLLRFLILRLVALGALLRCRPWLVGLLFSSSHSFVSFFYICFPFLAPIVEENLDGTRFLKVDGTCTQLEPGTKHLDDCMIAGLFLSVICKYPQVPRRRRTYPWLGARKQPYVPWHVSHHSLLGWALRERKGTLWPECPIASLCWDSSKPSHLDFN